MFNVLTLTLLKRKDAEDKTEKENERGEKIEASAKGVIL